MASREESPAASDNPIASRPETRTRERVLSVFLAFTLWCAMVFGGFYLAKQYLDRSIHSVQQTNAMHVQELEDRLDRLSVDLRGLEEALRSTGHSLSSSDSTQKELNRKIEDLDRQLEELERSLKVLKEAPNAAR